MSGHHDIDFASQTDVGMRRSHNQDCHASLPAPDPDQWLQRGHLFLVADGMGAHAVGELAAKLAADSIPHVYSKHAHEGPIAALRRAFVEANLSIHNRGQANQEFKGMGTTATALVLRPEGAWVGHVGDSRAYRVRNGKIEQLSFDHSLLWELARRQKKNPDDVEGVPSNVIVRSLGPEPQVVVDVEGPHHLQAGDTFVLCSDGLSGPVPDRQIGAVVSSLPPAEASRFLVHLANLNGGPDNITTVVILVKEARADPEKSAAATSSWAWLAWVPWALLSLLFGILLSVAAIYLAYARWGGEIPVFLLAAAFLLAGVIGLMIHSAQETQQAKPAAEVRPLRIYRQVDCAIDQGLVEDIFQTLVSLETRLRNNAWTLDWQNYQGLVMQGHDWQNRKKYPEAYREYCRAMLLLLDVVGAHQNREEAFKPLWDRPPEPRPTPSRAPNDPPLK